jgi:O-antigen/teichoic acid export membrane protein
MQSKLKQLSLNTASAYLSSVVNIIASVAFVPIALDYFGTTRYGILILINSILAYLMNTGFGLPQAVGVLGAQQKNPQSIKQIVYRAFRLIIIISCITIVGLLCISKWQLWDVILGQIPQEMADEFYQSVIWATLLFTLSTPFTSFSAGLIAFQKVYIERLYFTLSQLSSLISVLITMWTTADLATFFFLRGILHLSFNIISALHFFYDPQIKTPKESDQSPKDCSKNIPLIKTGYRFFFIGIAASVVWSTDTFVINYFIGTDAITPYAITFRLITFSFIIFSGLGAAVAPMMGKHKAEGDYAWIQQAYQVSLSFTTMLGGLIWIGTIAFSEEIIHLWVGGKGYNGLLTAFALGGYGYVSSFVFIHNALYSGLNLIDRGIRIGWSEALANLFFSFVLVQFWGSAGVAMGTFLGALTTVFWLLPREIKIKTQHKVNFVYSPQAKHFVCILVPALAISLFTKHLDLHLLPQILVMLFLIILYLYATYKIYPQEITNRLKFKQSWPFFDIQT